MCIRDSDGPPTPHEAWSGPASPYPGPMGAVRDDVVNAVCRELERVGNPDRAKGQQTYMKSTMPFRGIGAPQLRATLRPLLADPAHILTGRDEWEATIRRIWDAAQFRGRHPRSCGSSPPTRRARSGCVPGRPAAVARWP